MQQVSQTRCCLALSSWRRACFNIACEITLSRMSLCFTALWIMTPSMAGQYSSCSRDKLELPCTIHLTMSRHCHHFTPVPCTFSKCCIKGLRFSAMESVRRQNNCTPAEMTDGHYQQSHLVHLTAATTRHSNVTVMPQCLPHFTLQDRVVRKWDSIKLVGLVTSSASSASPPAVPAALPACRVHTAV